jgi:hypothetical protein
MADQRDAGTERNLTLRHGVPSDRAGAAAGEVDATVSMEGSALGEVLAGTPIHELPSSGRIVIEGDQASSATCSASSIPGPEVRDVPRDRLLRAPACEVPEVNWANIVLLALAAAVYPLLLAGVVVILTGPNPLPKLIGFLAGGLAISIGAGIAIVQGLGASGAFNKPSQSNGPVADSIEIAIGSVSLLIALGISCGRIKGSPLRRGDPVQNKESKPSLTARALSRGSVAMAVFVGVLLNLPGPLYLAALTEIASAKPSTVAALAAIVAFNVIMFAVAEVPIIAYVVEPGRTRERVNKSLRLDPAALARDHDRRLGCGRCVADHQGRRQSELNAVRAPLDASFGPREARRAMAEGCGCGRAWPAKRCGPAHCARVRVARRPLSGLAWGRLSSGVTVWAVLVPEGPAYASLAGVSPVTGFYAAPAALLLYAAFGSPRHLVTGGRWPGPPPCRRRGRQPRRGRDAQVRGDDRGTGGS